MGVPNGRDLVGAGIGRLGQDLGELGAGGGSRAGNVGECDGVERAFQRIQDVLRLEAVTRPDLLSRFGSDQFIALDRLRYTTDGTAVSLERSLMPASGGLESLPTVGLIENSLTITLAAYGYVGAEGDQWIGAEPLSDGDAELLGRPAGSVFLKASRTTYDRRERFMEHVESLLDPLHFRLHLQFGNSK